MRLLFLKPKHIGDSLLLTPTLTAIREQYPDAQIWVLVRSGCEGILEGCPAIDRVLTTAPPEQGVRGAGSLRRDLGLIAELRRQRFDFAFELADGDRGRWLAWLSGAEIRIGTRVNVTLGPLARRLLNRFSDYDWLRAHRVEKDFFTVHDGLPLRGPVPPLTFVQDRAKDWEGDPRPGRFAVLHPGTRWRRKRWPIPHWIEVGRHLLARLDHVVVSAGPDDEERAQAAELVQALGERAWSTDGKARWSQLAGLLWRAQMFVGVDTAAMHLAAACQCPTVAIFGPSVVGYWRPWRVAHKVVTAAPGPEFPPTPEAQVALEETTAEWVSVPGVLAACDRLLAAER